MTGTGQKLKSLIQCEAMVHAHLLLLGLHVSEFIIMAVVLSSAKLAIVRYSLTATYIAFAQVIRATELK